MKELSIEQKAKAYYETIKKLRDFYRDYDTVSCLIDVKDELANLFPELKESEDEKIRKALIEMVHDTTGDELWIDYDVHKEETLAWPEKQGERKPTDKVEPKFKVGDWIVNNVSKDTFLIKSVNSGYCSLEDTKGKIYSPCLPFESGFHLWTIQDAKSGDVIVDMYENIGIFEKIFGINWHTYCYLGYRGRFIVAGGSHGSICHPATKEQRDLLFQKMTESGYEWNAEKKELKKIERKPAAWSEEDEGIRNELIKYFTSLLECIATEERHIENRRWLNWLKSLKDKCTWKPSDEQMAALSDINITGCISYAGQGQELINLYNDLKKLRKE